MPVAGAVQLPLTNKKSTSEDRRQARLRRPVTTCNKLTSDECAAILQIINSYEFKDLPPSQIVPRFADQGVYLVSESTMQRLLRSMGQNASNSERRDLIDESTG